MRLLVLIFVSFTARAHASVLDLKISALPLDQTSKSLLSDLAVAHGLGRSVELKQLVQVPHAAQHRLSASDARVVRSLLAEMRLRINMSPAEIDRWLQTPDDPWFEAIQCGEFLNLCLAVDYDIFTNAELLEYADRAGASPLFSKISSKWQRNARACLEKTRARLATATATVKPTAEFRVTEHHDLRRRPVGQIIPPSIARILRAAEIHSVGELIDRTRWQLDSEVPLGQARVDDLEAILAGHELYFFGQEFRHLDVTEGLNLLLAKHDVRTNGRLIEFVDAPLPRTAWRALDERLSGHDRDVLRRAASRVREDRDHHLRRCREILGEAAGD